VVNKQLLIVSHYPLFDRGLQAMLSRRPGVEVVGVCRDLETATTQAQTLRPDILVVISEPADVRRGAALSRESALRQLKGLAPTLIQINLADNSMQVYRQQPAGPALVEMEQATLDDLVRTIQASADEQNLDWPKDESRENVVSDD
jgi:DNA-binding NarL/FixJ family response regulator